MLLNLAFVIIIALGFSTLFTRFRLPGLLGMILTGALLGPYAQKALIAHYNISILNPLFISETLINLSSELRTLALIVILIRAGLGINRKSLNTIGIHAAKMSVIPGLLEGAAVLAISMLYLNLPLFEAGMLGFIIAAVSPAVIVPSMLTLMESGLGKAKAIPTLILAGASVDDVVAITLFGGFLGAATGTSTSFLALGLTIPLSIILGLVTGALIGLLLVTLFKKYHMRDTKKVILFLVIAVLYHSLESIIPIATLIGIMAIGFMILEKYDSLAKRLATKFNKVWVLAEIILFVLIGAQVNILVAAEAGLIGLGIISLGLIARSMGVWISLIGSDLNKKEKLFCTIAYTPKATVQAAIGAIPLSMGVPSGELILALAVLSIIVTAPLGAIGISISAPHLLEKEPV
ncbi:MAG: cation:proton antiporter [Fibrobacterales bacterium]